MLGVLSYIFTMLGVLSYIVTIFYFLKNKDNQKG